MTVQCLDKFITALNVDAVVKGSLVLIGLSG